MELPIDTFGELTDPALTVQERMADLLEEIALADEVGLDVFGVGEHRTRRSCARSSSMAPRSRPPCATRLRAGALSPPSIPNA